MTLRSTRFQKALFLLSLMTKNKSKINILWDKDLSKSKFRGSKQEFALGVKSKNKETKHRYLQLYFIALNFGFRVKHSGNHIILSRGEIHHTSSSGRQIRTGLKFEANKPSSSKRQHRNNQNKKQNFIDIRTPQNYNIGELDESNKSEKISARSRSLK